MNWGLGIGDWADGIGEEPVHRPVFQGLVGRVYDALHEEVGLSSWS